MPWHETLWHYDFDYWRLPFLVFLLDEMNKIGQQSLHFDTCSIEKFCQRCNIAKKRSSPTCGSNTAQTSNCLFSHKCSGFANLLSKYGLCIYSLILRKKVWGRLPPTILAWDQTISPCVGAQRQGSHALHHLADTGKSKQLQSILGDVPLMPDGKVSHHVRHGNGHLEQEERGLPTITADRGRACCWTRHKKMLIVLNMYEEGPVPSIQNIHSIAWLTPSLQFWGTQF